MSYLIITATFSVYVVFGVPSWAIIKQIGYKCGITVAFLLIIVDFFVIGYSAHIVSFSLFLLALFIVGLEQVLQD